MNNTSASKNYKTWKLLNTLNIKELSDVKLVIGDEEVIYASKAILGCVEYFRNQFMRWSIDPPTDQSEKHILIKINSDFPTNDGHIRKISNDVIHDFIVLIYCINQPLKFQKYVSINRSKNKDNITYILELIILANYYQIGDKVSYLIDNLIKEGILQLGDPDSVAESFNEFILTLDTSMIELQHIAKLCKTIITYLVVQNIFGTNLYSIINDSKWRNAMCWLADFIVMNHFDLSNPYHINAVISTICDKSRKSLKHYLHKTMANLKDVGGYLAILREVFINLPDNKIQELCIALNINLNKITLTDMLFELDRTRRYIDVEVFITKISESSLESFIVDNYHTRLELEKCVKNFDNKKENNNNNQIDEESDSDTQEDTDSDY